jgi:TfoX/Sxy family transcriptional regulator of competence genes
MAYDAELAGRLRELLTGVPSVTEKRMFGGVGFLIGGNMAVSASGQGGLMVRVHPKESEALVANSPARYMVMRGREMPGWLRVDSSDVATPEALQDWVDRGVAYARSLPPK